MLRKGVYGSKISARASSAAGLNCWGRSRCQEECLCLGLIMQGVQEGGIVSKRAFPSPCTAPPGPAWGAAQDSPSAPPLARGDNVWATTPPPAERRRFGGTPVTTLVPAKMWKEENIHLPGVVEHGNARGKWSSLGGAASDRTYAPTTGRWKGQLRALFRPCPDTSEEHEYSIYNFI